MFKNRFFWISIVCLFMGYVSYDFLDQQFREKNISFHLERSQSNPLNAEGRVQIAEIIKEPFTYLDRGRQSFVFLSQDKRYVLKFFDSNKLTPGYFHLSKDEKHFKERTERLFNGYRLAYEWVPRETGLIFLQLAPGSIQKCHVQLVDRFGYSHSIDLSKVPFVIQKSATPTREVLTQLLNNGDVTGAKMHLRLLLEMYLSEYQKGIYDPDHNFMYNTGFVDGNPIHFDVGRLRKDENFKDPAFFLNDLKKLMFKRTGGWMQRHFPQYRDEILKDLESHKVFMDQN